MLNSIWCHKTSAFITILDLIYFSDFKVVFSQTEKDDSCAFWQQSSWVFTLNKKMVFVRTMQKTLGIQFCIWQYLGLDFILLVNDNEKEALSTYENNLNVKEYFPSLVRLLAHCVYNKSLIPCKCKHFLNLLFKQ